MTDDPYQTLVERLKEVCEPLGLTVRQFIRVVPVEEHEDGHVQVAFTIDRERLGKSAEEFEQTKKDRKAVEDMFRADAEARTEQEEKDAIEAARKLFDRFNK